MELWKGSIVNCTGGLKCRVMMKVQFSKSKLNLRLSFKCFGVNVLEVRQRGKKITAPSLQPSLVEGFHSRSLSRGLRELRALRIICCLSQCWSHKQALPCPLRPPEGLTVGNQDSSPDRLPERNHLAASRK